MDFGEKCTSRADFLPVPVSDAEHIVFSPILRALEESIYLSKSSSWADVGHVCSTFSRKNFPGVATFWRTISKNCTMQKCRRWLTKSVWSHDYRNFRHRLFFQLYMAVLVSSGVLHWSLRSIQIQAMSVALPPSYFNEQERGNMNFFVSFLFCSRSFTRQQLIEYSTYSFWLKNSEIAT
jgi:hypothetical protein